MTTRPDTSETPLTPHDVERIARAVVTEVERAVVGKRETIELVLIGVMAGGHVLLEDVPGLAKTLIVRSLARVLGLETSRIQFTPDLMPADVTGSGVFDQRRGELRSAQDRFSRISSSVTKSTELLRRLSQRCSRRCRRAIRI